jgi:hypothetical protein
MKPTKFLLWTEENAKNADKDTLFLILEEKEDDKSKIRLLFVDKNKTRIQNSTMLVFDKNHNGIMHILKNNFLDQDLPINADYRGELIIDSETDLEIFRYLQENIRPNEFMKFLKTQTKQLDE